MVQITMILIVLMSLVSCGKDNAQNISSPQTPTAAAIEAQIEETAKKELNLSFKTASPKNTWKVTYSQSILRHMETQEELATLIDTPLNTLDLRLLKCQGYNYASIHDKKKFWVTFMASIAHAESSLNPMTTYREKDGTLSSGLLQIDVAAANRHAGTYTGRRFTQADMFNPDLNLMAGLFIMKHQLEGSHNSKRPELVGRLFTDSHYYWSVLTSKRELIIKTFTLNSLTNLPFCFTGSW